MPEGHQDHGSVAMPVPIVSSRLHQPFDPDPVSLAVSREKDRKLHLVDAGWDDTKVVHPNGCGQARRGVGGWMLPPGRGER